MSLSFFAVAFFGAGFVVFLAGFFAVFFAGARFDEDFVDCFFIITLSVQPNLLSMRSHEPLLAE